MILSIADVLGPADVGAILHTLEKALFVDGKSTAGWAASSVKSNLQAGNDPAIADARELVAGRLRANPVFAIAAYPKTILGPQFSKYAPGDAYGRHVDEPIMNGVRVDLSFTLFLTPPEDYDGGELVIDTPAGEEAVKLPAGSAVVYPATTLHRVAAVARGERLAAVGWVRSLIRDAGQRELLFDLETARRRLFDRDGKSAEFDLLFKCSANLIRMWCQD